MEKLLVLVLALVGGMWVGSVDFVCAVSATERVCVLFDNGDGDDEDNEEEDDDKDDDDDEEEEELSDAAYEDEEVLRFSLIVTVFALGIFFLASSLSSDLLALLVLFLFP